MKRAIILTIVILLILLVVSSGCVIGKAGWYSQKKMPKIPMPQPSTGQPPSPAPAPPSPTPVPTPAPVPVPTVQQSNNISVAAIKIKYDSFSLDSLNLKLYSLFRNHPSVDLIVTPEYLFYRDFKTDPVVINCTAECTVYSTGTSRSDMIRQAVENMKNNAKKYNTNIVFGTVAEKDYVQGREIVFNTQLIIGRDGRILGKHRAAKRYDFYPYINCQDNPPICEEIYRVSLNTVQAYLLNTNEGVKFKIAPVICGEMIDAGYIQKMTNSQADLLVNSNFDQDCIWEDETELIQIGAPVPQSQFGCWAGIMQPLINTYARDNDIVKDDGHLLVSDGLTGSAGILSFVRKPVNKLELRADYVYGEIRLNDKFFS